MIAAVFVGKVFGSYWTRFKDPLYLHLISVPNKGATHSGFERLK